MLRLAHRMDSLGTETAFEVLARAKALATRPPSGETSGSSAAR